MVNGIYKCRFYLVFLFSIFISNASQGAGIGGINLDNQYEVILNMDECEVDVYDQGRYNKWHEEKMERYEKGGLFSRFFHGWLYRNPEPDFDDVKGVCVYQTNDEVSDKEQRVVTIREVHQGVKQFTVKVINKNSKLVKVISFYLVFEK